MCSTRACESEFYVRPSRVWDLSRWATDTEAPSTAPCPRDMHTYVKVDRVWNLEGAAKTNFKQTKPNKSLGSVQCKFYIYPTYTYTYIVFYTYTNRTYYITSVCTLLQAATVGSSKIFLYTKSAFFYPLTSFNSPSPTPTLTPFLNHISDWLWHLISFSISLSRCFRCSCCWCRARTAILD